MAPTKPQNLGDDPAFERLVLDGALPLAQPDARSTTIDLRGQVLTINATVMSKTAVSSGPDTGAQLRGKARRVGDTRQLQLSTVKARRRENRSASPIHAFGRVRFEVASADAARGIARDTGLTGEQAERFWTPSRCDGTEPPAHVTLQHVDPRRWLPGIAHGLDEMRARLRGASASGAHGPWGTSAIVERQEARRA